MPATPLAEPTLRRLAALKPTTIALMHGPTFKGDGGGCALERGCIWRRSTMRRARILRPVCQALAR